MRVPVALRAMVPQLVPAAAAFAVVRDGRGVDDVCWIGAFGVAVTCRELVDEVAGAAVDVAGEVVVAADPVVELAMLVVEDDAVVVELAMLVDDDDAVAVDDDESAPEEPPLHPASRSAPTHAPVAAAYRCLNI